MNTRLVLDTSAVLAYFEGSVVAREAMNRAEAVYLLWLLVTLTSAFGVFIFGVKERLRLT